MPPIPPHDVLHSEAAALPGEPCHVLFCGRPGGQVQAPHADREFASVGLDAIFFFTKMIIPQPSFDREFAVICRE